MKNKFKCNRGEMGLGTLLILVIIGCFIIWVLTGGVNQKNEVKPFVNPYTDTENPGGTYGPTEQ
jgi:hypothetical protein